MEKGTDDDDNNFLVDCCVIGLFCRLIFVVVALFLFLLSDISYEK